jgi:NaMN:DMB phosphoribosyltransferase
LVISYVSRSLPHISSALICLLIAGGAQAAAALMVINICSANKAYLFETQFSPFNAEQLTYA